MPNGLHAASSGVIAQQLKMDAIANDIANVNTTGYKRTRVTFQEVVSGVGGDGTGSGVRIGQAQHVFDQGLLFANSNPIAVGLDGPGFIQVKRGDGTLALTRDGDLRVDSKGALTLAGGERLEPAITLPTGYDLADVKISEDGTVTLAGKKLGQLTVVAVTAPDGLLHVGDNLFQLTAASGPAAPAKDAVVHQGFIEGSNVDLATAMVDLIETQRGFDLTSRSLRTHDQLLEIANAIRR
ncbi:MAG: flagellar hook-basal body protein [Gaiella sp.]